jgi:hypothetical protein
MKIETKFNVGQEVWRPVCYREGSEICPFIIKSIQTFSEVEWNGGTRTTIMYHDTTGKVSTYEGNLFLTEAAALSEIERRKAK